MKRNYSSRLSILSILLILLLSLSSGIAQEEQKPIAVTVKVEGKVYKKEALETQFSLPVEKGNLFKVGDGIKTEKSSYAALMYTDDKSLIKVKEESVLEFNDAPGVRTINVRYGTIKAEIEKQEGREYRIETPTSVASVKGTSFWAICMGNSGDRFYGIDGVVQVFNFVSGVSVTLAGGQMVISTADGQLLTMPYTESEVPADFDTAAAAPPEGIPEGGTAPEEPTVPQPETPVTPEMGETVTPPEQPPAVGGEGEGRNWNMGLGLGSVTIDGTLYNQIALRPELKFGKLGVGLDVVIYMDANGNIRKQEWDEFSDYLDKIYYIRWAQPGDPFFVKFGALDNITLGYGILVNGYSNTTEYPQVRKVGLHVGMQFEKMGWEAFMANVKETFGPGLMGGRVTYQPLKAIPLTLGGSLVIDGNQYQGLKDTDGDGVPDVFDAFPDKTFRLPDYYYSGAFGYEPGQKLKGKKYQIDSDKDGIPDEIDYDRDGDGLTDNYDIDPSKNFPLTYPLSPEPFSTEDRRKSLMAVAFDVAYPALNMNMFKLVVYGQAASFLPFWKVKTYDGVEFTPGWGIAAPGLRMNIIKIINLGLEYRYSGSNFIYSFWDRAYDFERVIIRNKPGSDNELWPYTKDEIKLHTDPMQGIFGSADVNILNYLILGASYQQMITSGEEVNSFLATATIPKGKIPKLAEATAFYIRNNDKNPFDFKHPSENTILGYRLGFETSGGFVITYVYQISYRDQNGDGKIDPKDDAIKISTIETGINF